MGDLYLELYLPGPLNEIHNPLFLKQFVHLELALDISAFISLILFFKTFYIIYFSIGKIIYNYTLWPKLINFSAKWLPIKPAPPVIIENHLNFFLIM